MRRAAVVLAAALALSACAAFSPRNPPAVAFAPLAPASLGRTVQAEQILRIAYGERSLSLQCVAGVTHAETALSCFTALGQRAFHLKHDGQAVSAETSAQDAAQAMSPERILTDLQLAYWPLPALAAAFAGGGWQISEPTPGLRRLRRDGALYAEVHYASASPWNGRLWLVNFEQRYSLDIESRLVGKN